MESFETAMSLLMIAVIAVSGITVLPWYDREWRSSARAFGTLGRLLSGRARSLAHPAPAPTSEELRPQPIPSVVRA